MRPSSNEANDRAVAVPGDGVVPVLRAQGLSKQFGATRALAGISLRVEGGEVHCLLGENGAGKSTLAKILGGLHAPDAGEIEILGRRVRLHSVAEARAHGVAMVFQELSLAPDLTVRENICLGSERGRLPLRLTRSRQDVGLCRSLMAAFGLDLDLTARVGTLPVATQQLVEVAKALAQTPRLLVLDEPTAMLGVREAAKLLEMIRRVRTQGTAVVFVTHHIEEVLEVGDRVSLMKDGAIVDSFPITQELSAGQVIEKLTGKRIAHDMAARAGVSGAQRLVVSGLCGANRGSCEIAVGTGEIVGLYGVVGCGRERIGDTVIGLARMPGTMMSLDGTSYVPRNPAAAARAGVAYLPAGRAGNGILPARSIRENLTLGWPDICGWIKLAPLRKERDLARRHLIQLRTRFAEIEDPITALSGGNQQKVLLGRALGRATRLLVLEDPTAGVDVGAKQDIHDLIRGRAAAGAAVLLLSSDLLETISLCDVVYTIRAGMVIGTYRAPTLADEPQIIADILGGSLDSAPTYPAATAGAETAYAEHRRG